MATCPACLHPLRAPTPCTQFEIDQFRAAMPALGWEESMLDWRCMDRTQLRAQLGANASGGGCDVIVAGLPISTAQLAQGVSFTYPTSW